VTPRLGLVLFGRDVSSTALTAVGVGTRSSSYTEADPGPGHPEPQEAASRWRPFLSGAQSVALTVGTQRGGYPGRDGASVLYRLGADTSLTDLRSWQDPVLITGWSAPAEGWGGSQVYDAFAAAVIAETGLVVVTAAVSGTNDAVTWSYNPRTRAWSQLYDWAAGALDGLVLPIGMAYDQGTGKLLLWSGFGADGDRTQVAYESTDGGTTWSVYSRGFAAGIGAGAWATTGIYRPVIGTDLDWLMEANEKVNDVTGNSAHLASSDRGVTWDLIVDSGDDLRPGQPFYGPAGFGYVHIDPTHSNRLSCRIAATARSTFATEIVIDDSVSWSACWACADYDGTIYAVARGASGATTFGDFYAFRSLDGGLTWDRYGWGVLSTSSSTRTLEPHLLLASQGHLYLLGTTVGSTNTDHTVNLVQLGGWSQVAHGSGTTTYVRTSLHRFGYGVDDPDAAAAAWTAGYLPIALPNNTGWTAGASTGTISLTDAEPALHLSTTAGQGADYFIAAPHSATYAACEFEVKLNSTGNVSLATLGASGRGVYALFFLSSGAYYYEARLDVGTTGIQLVDTNPAGSPTIRGTTTGVDPRAQYTRVRLHLTKGTASAWVSTDGGVVWQRFADNVTISNSAAFAAGADGIFWGIQTAQVGNAYFRFVGAGAAVDWQYGIDAVGALGDTPATGPLGHNFGHPVPGRGASYPIPEGTASGEDLALLSATGGPTHYSELVDLPVAYGHGVDAADPLLFPSPRRTWQTADDTTWLVYDQGANQQTWFGGALALLVIGVPRLWTLDRDDGSTGWESLGTLDLALGTGLKWIRVGRTVTANSGTATISRRIAENELAGGTFDLDGTCRRILRNSAGFWTDDSTQQITLLTLDGVTGSEASSGTAGVLCAAGGILIAYPSAGTPRRYLRVGAAASQVSPDNRYEAGIVAVGRVVGLGTPGWGSSTALAVSRTYTVATDGVSTATQLGPPRRQISYAWPEPAPMLELRTLTAGPSPIKASGGVPFGTELNQVDVPALVEELESGALPCALVSALPSATGTILDRTLWAYGRPSGVDVGISIVQGTEGTDEAVTVGGITLEEIR
jgi:hypothetical protein